MSYLYKENELKLLKVAEVSQLLKVKLSYVYELIYSRKLEYIRLSERRIRIPESALNEFITSQYHTKGLQKKGGNK